MDRRTRLRGQPFLSLQDHIKYLYLKSDEWELELSKRYSIDDQFTISGYIAAMSNQHNGFESRHIQLPSGPLLNEAKFGFKYVKQLMKYDEANPEIMDQIALQQIQFQYPQNFKKQKRNNKRKNEC
jgi:hypothetical protein